MNHIVKLLENARDLIADSQSWTQRVAYRNSLGYETHIGSPETTKWCAVGAIRDSAMHLRENIPFKTSQFDRLQFDQLVAVESLLNKTAKNLFGFECIAEVNDDESRTAAECHERVLQVYDEAILICKGSGE